jgi:hypothetical protein
MSFLLQQTLLDPQRVTGMDHRQWEKLLAQARNSRLLASLATELNTIGLLEALPENIRRHLQSGLLVHEKQKKDLAYESQKIRSTLQSIGEKTILLKGGAYILAHLPVGNGRLITDIDIIVPRENIERVEQTLIASGWEGGHLDDYDDEYYRQWGHEIPPLTNRKRGTTLDVHHNILPPTAGPDVDARLLLEDVIEVKPGIFTLSWQDMVIHSATHLFHEGEFHHGLRDLWDLDRMLRDFPYRDPRFWDDLVARADRLQLQVSLFHGLNYTQKVFGTPIPEGVLQEAAGRSRRLRKPVMDFLFLRAFRPDHPDSRLPLRGTALFLLYIRSHYLRMPFRLLIPHLARKAWKRRFKDEADALAARQAKEPNTDND